MAKVTKRDFIRLGTEAATVKSGMKLKDWRKFKKEAKQRGFTLRSAASDTPNALKERTRASLRKEARNTIAAAYKPAVTELTTRERAIQHLDQARAASEQGFNTWLAGEQEKLAAQGRAADGALATQQQSIAADNDAALKAAQADSLQRMGAMVGVSDPSQSAALQGTAAADQASRAGVANARMFSGDLSKIAETSRQSAAQSTLAQAAANAVIRNAETTKAMSELTADRTKLRESRTADASELAKALRDRNIEVTKHGREYALAAGELGHKQEDLAAQVREANREFRLDKKEFNLKVWEAKNDALAERMRIDLGYDQIKASEGKAAADRALREKIVKYQERKRDERLAKDREADEKDKSTITPAETNMYHDITVIAGLLTRWRKNNAVPSSERRQKLREMNFSDAQIDLAKDYRGGNLSPAGRELARKIGITHVKHFFG